VVDRVRQSVAEGVKEIRLTSEDAGAYGRDIGTNIAALLRDVLEAVPDGVMVKLGMVRHFLLFSFV
jgi:threonylcarbamoyladenosine tRNA methylthiotransferase CDKAL1